MASVSDTSLLALLGALTLVNFLYRLLAYLYFQLRPSSLPRYHHAGPNGTDKPWALVTGASDGIGLAFAHELASRNFNIVLHGRNETKLSGVKKTLESTYPSISAKLLVLEATLAPGPSFEAAVLKVIRPLPLTVLVNNIGGASVVEPEFVALSSRTAAEVDALLNFNVGFMLHLTRIALPILERNQPALILNISSVTEIIPSPWVAVYSGGKGFVSAFTRSLRAELRADGKDVDVMSQPVARVVTPGARKTERDLALDTVSPQAIVRASLNRVGCGYAVATPYWFHQVQLTFMSLLPERVGEWFVTGHVRKEMRSMDMERERKAK